MAAGLGFFGAPDAARSARGERASLEVFGPRVIRTGEIFEMRFRVRAIDDLDTAIIRVDEAIWEDITINTTVPAATEETHEDGAYRFSIGPLAAGTSYLFKADLQINPDHFGANNGTIGLMDGSETLAEITYELGVLP